MSKKYYKETVEISGKRYWIIAIGLIFLYSLLGISSKMNESDNLMSISGFGIELIAFGAIIFMVLKTKLKTKVTSKSIDVKFSPFYRSKLKIAHDDVASFRVEETEPFTIRTGKNFSSWLEKRFTLTGRNGVCITTWNGRKYFIGSTNPEAFSEALLKVYSKN